jgi:16S rRNA (guanine527-N7)-methyltransferase
LLNYKETAAKFGISLTGEQLRLLTVYAQFLTAQNKVLNLTAVKPENYFVDLFLDSLMAIKTGLIAPELKLVDIGSGAGLPALPLKIYQPTLKVYLIEAATKKAVFLQQAVALLALKDVFIFNERAEVLARKTEMREKFNLATARAVAHLSVLLEYSLPFVRVGGYFLAYKGPKGWQELQEAQKALTLLGGEVKATKQYKLNGKERLLLTIKKTACTPEKYPRRVGVAKKRPLG